MWLLLVYKVAPEPSARRVYVWRKLKRLGAILLHDAVWVLPSNPSTREQLQWLSGEISEMGGDVYLWQADLALPAGDKPLIDQFNAQADSGYSDILADLEQPEADLAALSRRYQQVRLQDYFQSPVGPRVRAALLAAGRRLDE